MAIKGLKAVGILTNTFDTPITDQIALYDIRPSSVTIAKESESRDVQGFVDGNDTLQITDSYNSSDTYTITTEMGSIDSGTLALLFGECWAMTSSYSDYPKLRRVEIPSSGAFEVADADIGGSYSAADVQVLISEAGSWGRVRPLTVITEGTPTAEQVKLDAANSKLIFAEENAGAPIKYALKKELTNIYTLGVQANPKLLDSLKFVGEIATTRGRNHPIIIPGMTRTGGWEVAIGDETTLSIEFRGKIVGAKRSVIEVLEV